MGTDCLKYACLFGGGAIRGAAHAGVVKAMEELGIQYDTVAGSSVGSIVAALLAAGFNADELKEIFLKVNFELFKDIHLGFGNQFAISKGEVFLEWIRELIEKKYYGSSYVKGKNKPVTFADMKKNLVIITTNLSDFTCKEFSKSKTPDYEIAAAVKISSSMPGLMKPVEYENSLLVDGDLQKSWPMWRLTDTLLNLEERILEVRLEGDYGGDDMNVVNYFNTVYSCVTSFATDFVLDRYIKNDKYDFIVVNTGDVIIIDFNQPEEKREHLMEIGYNQTIKYFKKYLPEKKDKIFAIYDNMYSQFNKINRAVHSNKIQKAKMILYETYAFLCENMCYIDPNEYLRIKEFKNIFIENIKYPALFGNISFKSRKSVKEKSENITDMLFNKLTDLKNYDKTIKNSLDNQHSFS